MQLQRQTHGGSPGRLPASAPPPVLAASFYSAGQHVQRDGIICNSNMEFAHSRFSYILKGLWQGRGKKKFFFRRARRERAASLLRPSSLGGLAVVVHVTALSNSELGASRFSVGGTACGSLIHKVVPRSCLHCQNGDPGGAGEASVLSGSRCGCLPSAEPAISSSKRAGDGKETFDSDHWSSIFSP